MSVHMSRCVVEGVSGDRIMVVRGLLWPQWQLFGESILKSCLSSRSLLLSVFPVNQRGLFS